MMVINSWLRRMREILAGRVIDNRDNLELIA